MIVRNEGGDTLKISPTLPPNGNSGIVPPWLIPPPADIILDPSEQAFRCDEVPIPNEHDKETRTS